MQKVNKTDSIFIAGQSGMVGSAIRRKLKENGYQNLFTPARKNLDLGKSKYLSTEFDKDRNIADNLEEIKNYLNEADRYYEDNRIIEAIDYYEKVLSKSSSEIKEILGNDAMIKLNNRILEYRRMINS